MKQRPEVITVFGGSGPREGDWHYGQAYALGVALAQKGLVVCNGGYGGTMEAVSRGAKQAGGRTLGVTAQSFNRRANRWIDQDVPMKTWRARLFELIRRGRGYVACPGGTGTLVELAVVWEMLNKGAMRHKPLVVLGDFWKPVIDRVQDFEPGQSTRPGERGEELVHVVSSPADAAGYLAEYFLLQREPH
ncbi:MAG TPA: LOG family protein [Candidatus Acidoferrales bacterium]